MEKIQVEAMNLHLRFACTVQGECDREFFCVNPHFILEPVCPHLVAWDGLAKSMKAEGIPLAKKE